MSYRIPDKLKPGDEVRVIAPAQSMIIIGQETRDIAKQRFDKLGLKLTFGKHVEENDDFMSSSVESRLEDLHDAFADKNVKAILTVIGGFNSNQLLRQIDWELLKNNPKIFCGFSDITAIGNAISAVTGMVTYSGVHYSTFGMKKHFEEFSMDFFEQAVMDDSPIEVLESKEWFDDEWWMDQDNRVPTPNEGWQVINEGAAEGTIVGGNLCTLNLLQGTEFMPNLKDTVVFIEDDGAANKVLFDRDLVSLIQQPGFEDVKGIVIGRFQKTSDISMDILSQIVKTKPELANIPVIANVDFGHTYPMITFPIGGEVKIDANKQAPKITITKH